VALPRGDGVRDRGGLHHGEVVKMSEEGGMDKADKIAVSAGYLLDTMLWDAACEEIGMSVWVVNEGQMDRSEMVTFTIEQAERIGLLPVRKSFWD